MTTAMPLISVIIPNWNYAAYLREAVESGLGQSYANVEVIVVDDGSTDGSEAVVRSYGDRVQWFRQERQGVSAARNRGIQESRGELIAFLDADDRWSREKLARQVECLENSGVGLVLCGLQFISASGELLGTSVSGLSGRVLKEITLLRWPGSPGLGSTALIRRECLDRVGLFDAELSTSADWDLWRRIACHYEIGMVREPLVFYRVHGASMHRSVELFERDMLRAFARVFADPDAAAVHPLRRQCYGNLYLMLAGSYLHDGRWYKCLDYALRGMCTWPPSLARAAVLALRRLRGRRQTRVGDRASHITLAPGAENVPTRRLAP
jgi:glycosyltransferase involved in cell wall biosynthesis